MSQTTRFAVMGDMHYVQPVAHSEAFSGRPRGVTELVDLHRNYWMTQHVTPKVLAAIAAQKPDFVIQTGDLMHGHCDTDGLAMQEMTEALDLVGAVQAPLLFALGTHDGTLGKRQDQPVKELLLPTVAKTLGRPVHTGYYSYEFNNSLFLILDYATFSHGDAQAEFLKQTILTSKHEHLFVFAHPPLIPIGRPFFTSWDFSQAVLDGFKVNPFDAYFCGHTHNQVASLHQVGDHWMPQLKSSVLGYPNEAPVGLGETRPILPPEQGFELGWGFLEDSAPSWYLVTVEGEQVIAEWHVYGAGVQGQLTWRRGEKPRFTQLPTFPPNKASLPPLSAIKRVRLRAAGSGCRAEGAYQVKLNNRSLGRLPRLEYFDCRQFLEIDQAEWPGLGDVNQLQVTTAAEEMGIGGFVLEIETEDGWSRSSVSQFFANTHKWDRWQTPALSHVEPGSTVQVELSFRQSSTGEVAL